jgi:hypothetical protein
MPALLFALLLLTSPAVAGDWDFAAGPTREDGTAVELARSTRHWQVAFGYVSEQQVLVRTLQDFCGVGPGGPGCTTVVNVGTRDVEPYGYLSVQRRLTLRDGARLRPTFGLGLVLNSDTNPYVSSAMTFSLSAGLRLNERWALEVRHFSNADLQGPNLGQDMLLLRARFGNP